jgi:hypothetical protein
MSEAQVGDTRKGEKRTSAVEWFKVLVVGCVFGASRGWLLGTLIHALSGW